MIKLVTTFLVLLQTVSCLQEEHQTRGDAISDAQRIDENRLGTCVANSRFAADLESAWQQASNTYGLALAREEDLTFPSSAVSNHYLATDIKKWMKCPVQTGDFNGDLTDDLLVLAVDKQSESEQRFSLVVINVLSEPGKDERIPFSLKFVYRNENLSSTYVGRNREGLSVDRYRSDGTVSNCYIRWSPTTESYQCAR